MTDDARPAPDAGELPMAPVCPWCSAALPGPDAATCPGCGAHLVQPSDVEIPGVTAVDSSHRASATSPRRVQRTFGSLFVGNDDEIPPPSEAELPALAPPDPDVRREMLRLELDARLAALQAEVTAMEAEAKAGAAGIAAAAAAETAAAHRPDEPPAVPPGPDQPPAER